VTTDEVPAVLERLQQAVAAGELPEPAVDAAVQRIAKAKQPDAHCGG
jgi:beta-N-acetylhexosaminidase